MKALTPIKVRKVCTNCKMNAMHNNKRFDLANWSVYLTRLLTCENCGKTSTPN